MIKMQFVGGAADDTLPSISLPDFELDRTGNDSAALRVQSRRTGQVLVALHCQQFELEDSAVIIFLCQESTRWKMPL